MLVLADNSCENLVSSNHLLRDREPWAPMQKYDNGLDDLFGLLRIDGSNNSVIANHISETIDTQYIKPIAAKPVIINLVSGSGNYIANNHIVATTEKSQSSDAPESACFSTQVGALLSTSNLETLEVTAVKVQEGSVRNTVLDSGSDEQVQLDRTMNAFRATPAIG
jgi:inulin fructotransferase (DFA-I-forming)